MFHFTTTLRSPAHVLRTPSSSASPVVGRLTAQRGLQARKAASAERKLKVKNLKNGKLPAIQGDKFGATATVELPITPISSGTDASKSSIDTAQLKSLISSTSPDRLESTSVTSAAKTIKLAASATVADSSSSEAGLSTKAETSAFSNSALSTYSLDDDRESALSLAGSAWTADSDDDVFYDAVEEQPLDGVVRNVEIGDWVERVLATPLLIPSVSDAEYAEWARKDEERLAKWAREDAAKAAKVVVEVVPQVVEQPPAHEPLPRTVANEAFDYLSFVQYELARQTANNAVELFPTVAPVEKVEPVVEMEVDPVLMDVDFPSATSSSLLIPDDDDMDVDDVLMEIDLELSTEDRMDFDEPDSSSSFSSNNGPCAMDVDAPYTFSYGFSSTPAGAAAFNPAPSAIKVNKQRRRPAARAPLPDQRGAFLGRSVISPLGVKLHVPNGMGSSQIKFNAPGRVFENKVAASLGKVDRHTAPLDLVLPSSSPRATLLPAVVAVIVPLSSSPYHLAVFRAAVPHERRLELIPGLVQVEPSSPCANSTTSNLSAHGPSNLLWRFAASLGTTRLARRHLLVATGAQDWLERSSRRRMCGRVDLVDTLINLGSALSAFSLSAEPQTSRRRPFAFSAQTLELRLGFATDNSSFHLVLVPDDLADLHIPSYS